MYMEKTKLYIYIYTHTQASELGREVLLFLKTTFISIF